MRDACSDACDRLVLGGRSIFRGEGQGNVNKTSIIASSETRLGDGSVPGLLPRWVGRKNSSLLLDSEKSGSRDFQNRIGLGLGLGVGLGLG